MQALTNLSLSAVSDMGCHQSMMPWRRPSASRSRHQKASSTASESTPSREEWLTTPGEWCGQPLFPTPTPVYHTGVGVPNGGTAVSPSPFGGNSIHAGASLKRCWTSQKLAGVDPLPVVHVHAITCLPRSVPPVRRVTFRSCGTVVHGIYVGGRAAYDGGMREGRAEKAGCCAGWSHLVASRASDSK